MDESKIRTYFLHLQEETCKHSPSQPKTVPWWIRLLPSFRIQKLIKEKVGLTSSQQHPQPHSACHTPLQPRRWGQHLSACNLHSKVPAHLRRTGVCSDTGGNTDHMHTGVMLWACCQTLRWNCGGCVGPAVCASTAACFWYSCRPFCSWRLNGRLQESPWHQCRDWKLEVGS